MINKFIKLNDTLINANYIMYLNKVIGKNDYIGKFGIFAQCKGFTNHCWFDSEKERDKEYDNITKILIQYGI